MSAYAIIIDLFARVDNQSYSRLYRVQILETRVSIKKL